MGDFLPDGLPTFKVVNEVLELTGFNRFELWIAELFNKLPFITLKKLLLAPRGFLIRKVLVLNNQLICKFQDVGCNTTECNSNKKWLHKLSLIFDCDK